MTTFSITVDIIIFSDTRLVSDIDLSYLNHNFSEMLKGVKGRKELVYKTEFTEVIAHLFINNNEKLI